MSLIATNNHSTQRPLAERHAAHVTACWPRVRVESAEVTPGPDGASARAVVQLGRLTPADVRVELMPLASGVTDAASHAMHRLFSSQDYCNGCFVFEALLPRSSTTLAHDWLLHVHPSEAIHEPRVEYRFRSASA